MHEKPRRPLVNPNDALDAEAIDAALAALIAKAQDFVKARPTVEMRAIPRPAWRDIAAAAVSGFLAKRAEQRVNAGDDFLDLVESRGKPFNDAIPFGGDTETLG